MAANTDHDRPRTEETPLLADRESSPVDGPENDSEDGSEDTKPSDPEATTRSPFWYLWRILWVLVALSTIALFTKGWLDADGDVKFDLRKALKKALGGGLSGAAAMLLQVLLLMPLRTVMNYQYRYGSSFTIANRTLYHESGIGRYYQGLAAALIQGPTARFGDTAANAGILALLQSNSYLRTLPSLAKTVFASLCAAGFRMILTPVDTVKTTLQAQGSRGKAVLRKRIKKHGLGTLWWGAFATAGATFAGHYPWFGTYNFLSEHIKEPSKEDLLVWLARLAFIGFVASVVSDSVSNSLRVVKTFRQVSDERVSYTGAARRIISEEGILGLMGRGLKTRILANGLQGLLFSILWKLFQDMWDQHTEQG